MAQVLIWNGEDRPPIVTVEPGAFPQGVPAVGDNVTVRRGGVAVGQVSIERLQLARRRAMVELVQGDLPEAGDTLRFGAGNEAIVASVQNAPARRGDIVSIIDDGAHPGTKVVTSATWSDPVDYRSDLGRGLTAAERAAGEWPDFVIADIPGPTAEQAKVALANRAAAIMGLPGTPRTLPQYLGKSVRIDYEDLPLAVRADLRDDGRTTTTGAQLMPFVKLKRGITVADLQAMVTDNGEQPEELTTYL